jgi:hypothetical protein
MVVGRMMTTIMIMMMMDDDDDDDVDDANGDVNNDVNDYDGHDDDDDELGGEDVNNDDGGVERKKKKKMMMMMMMMMDWVMMLMVVVVVQQRAFGHGGSGERARSSSGDPVLQALEAVGFVTIPSITTTPNHRYHRTIIIIITIITTATTITIPHHQPVALPGARLSSGDNRGRWKLFHTRLQRGRVRLTGEGGGGGGDGGDRHPGVWARPWRSCARTPTCRPGPPYCVGDRADTNHDGAGDYIDSADDSRRGVFLASVRCSFVTWRCGRGLWRGCAPKWTTCGPSSARRPGATGGLRHPRSISGKIDRL